MKITFNKVNGAIAFLYGIAALLAPIYFIIKAAIAVSSFEAHDSFSWGAFVGITVLLAAVAFSGYALLKVGIEQFRK